jgi:SM-20-related protein
MPSDNEYAYMLDELAEKGWAIQENFIPLPAVRKLTEEELRLYAEGKFKKAGIGPGKQVTENIRGDYIHWFDAENLSKAQKMYWDKIRELSLEINSTFFSGLKDFECHFALYPSGTFYKTHLDQFQNNNSRQISCILYLNRDWKQEDGGQLRLYAEGQRGFTDVFPREGLFVCFRSALIRHEVVHTKRDRYSITGWLKN